MSKEIGLRMGAIAPPIEQQLKEQGFTLKNPQIYQDQADRISHLNVGGILTDGEARKARQRLFNKIKGDVEAAA